MITINSITTDIYGFEAAIRGMRNSYNSWNQSDSGDGCELGLCEECPAKIPCDMIGVKFTVGPKDYELMKKLCKGGPSHAKFRRMVHVSVDVTAPLYWWKEFDTYKVGTVANSCSTMHTIASRKFTREDFSCEHLIFAEDVPEEEFNDVDSISEADALNDKYCAIEDWDVFDRTVFPGDLLDATIMFLNKARVLYLKTKDKKYWWQMIQLLPSSFNQKRTIDLNYEVLHTIYEQRKNHKLYEWREFCKWIESLPYARGIIIEELGTEKEEIAKAILEASFGGEE